MVAIGIDEVSLSCEQLEKIANKFHSVHFRDFLLLPLLLAFGFAIDGLYGMGHFLSFGIAAIAATQFIVPREIVRSSKLSYLLGTLLVLIFAWHGVVKFSIWQGLDQFEKNKYPSAISHLERAIRMYPKPIGRFHILLGQMYIENGELERVRFPFQNDIADGVIFNQDEIIYLIPINGITL